MGLALSPGYSTAAGQVFHTATLLSSFPATLYSTEWTLGFRVGWCGIYLLFILMFLTEYQQTTNGISLFSFTGLATLAKIREGESNTLSK